MKYSDTFTFRKAIILASMNDELRRRPLVDGVCRAVSVSRESSLQHPNDRLQGKCTHFRDSSKDFGSHGRPPHSWLNWAMVNNLTAVRGIPTHKEKFIGGIAIISCIENL